jgi:hypothetical protein
MAQRFNNPFPQFWSSSAAYVGGTLSFFSSGTSTPLAVYSDKALVTSIGTSVTLDSAGRYVASDIFLQNLDYKIVLKGSNGTTIWTADPVRGSDFTSIPLWSVGSGSPSGVVAGTAGSAGIMPSMYWDFANSVMYVTTTTGSASTAVWTAINATAATAVVTAPQGRLTLTSATPVLAADVTAATSVFYTPYVGSLVPIYNGASFAPQTFSELTLTLASQHSLNSIYDVFAFNNSGVITLVTGPAWTTITAGSGARGTGAGTTQLTRISGLNVNAVSITGRNGATTYSIGANLATYLGTLYIDGTAGQITCHTSWGQSRKWGVWNAFNKIPILLHAGDSTATWNYTTATFRAANNASANSLTVLAGLPEDPFELSAYSKALNAASAALMEMGIGWNSTTTPSGLTGCQVANTGGGANMEMTARHQNVPTIGINVATLLEKSAAAGTTTWSGTNANQVLSAKWWG